MSASKQPAFDEVEAAYVTACSAVEETPAGSDKFTQRRLLLDEMADELGRRLTIEERRHYISRAVQAGVIK